MSSRSKSHVRRYADGQNSHVYLVAHRVGASVHAPVRIGITQDLATQVATLQDSCPFEITLIHALHFPSNRDLAQDLYDSFSKGYAQHALGRGWFDLKPEAAFSNLLVQLDCLVTPIGRSVETCWDILDSFNAGDQASDTLYFLRTDPG